MTCAQIIYGSWIGALVIYAVYLMIKDNCGKGDQLD